MGCRKRPAVVGWVKRAPNTRKPHVTAVLGAKATDTRARRIAKIVDALKA
jgi:hypothetical protein